jgi:very-short-patch-repair endonuclease
MEIRNKKASSLEVIVAAMLDTLGIKYWFQRKMFGFVPDFVLIGRKIVIECDGGYWHSRPGAPERDARKDVVFADKGYTVLRLPSKLVYNEPLTVEKRIAAFCKIEEGEQNEEGRGQGQGQRLRA